MYPARTPDATTMPVSRAPLVILGLLLLGAVAPLHGKVCGTVDIKNNLGEFEKLKNCTVVNGNLKISLMEDVEEHEFERVSFPELVEVKGYLLVFRVWHLRTLAKLFPNLSVIRGEELVRNYALIIYNNKRMEEVGTGSFFGMSVLYLSARGHHQIRLLFWGGKSSLSLVFENAENIKQPTYV